MSHAASPPSPVATCADIDHQAPQEEVPPARPADRDDLTDAIAALSRVLVGITARTLVTLDADLTLPQYRFLVVLASGGPQRSIDLARALEVHPSTVTRVCDRLIRRGLVQRQHRQYDRRVSWLALTEPGRELLGQVIQRRTARIRELLDKTPINDAEKVVGFLDALVVSAGDLPEQQWWQRWTESAVTDDEPSCVIT